MCDVIFDPENNEGNPDDAEADEMRLVERFFVEKDTDEELQRGRDVLKNANHRKWNLFSSGGKHEQRNCGDDARAHEEQVNRCAIVQETSRAIGLNKNKIDQGDGENNACFKCEAIE